MQHQISLFTNLFMAMATSTQQLDGTLMVIELWFFLGGKTKKRTQCPKVSRVLAFMLLNLMLDLSEISAFFCCCDRRLVCFKAKDVIKTDSTPIFCSVTHLENFFQAYDRHVKWCMEKARRLQTSPPKDLEAIARQQKRLTYR